MIKKTDGTPFRPLGNLQRFDPENPKHDLFNKWDAEVTSLFGSPIYYFEIFINFENIDKLYLEDRSKIWSQFPVELFCSYEPIPSQNAQGTFGIDAPDEQVFRLNFRDTINKLGHPPKIGARLYTPLTGGENWVIIQRNRIDHQDWSNGIGLELVCQKFQESLTDSSGKGVSQPTIDPEIKLE